MKRGRHKHEKRQSRRDAALDYLNNKAFCRVEWFVPIVWVSKDGIHELPKTGQKFLISRPVCETSEIHD